MGAEESDDRKRFGRWSELTLHILLCNPVNSCSSLQFSYSFFFPLLLTMKDQLSHPGMRSVSCRTLLFAWFLIRENKSRRFRNTTFGS